MKEQFIKKGDFYMDIEEVKEWIRLAESDLDAAKILNEAPRKHYENICYNCAQAVEKYLKGYLVYNGIEPQKTHDLLFLNKICSKIDKLFENIVIECGFLKRCASDMRYPHKYEITGDDVSFSIKATEKVRNCKPINDMIINISKSTNQQ